MLGRKKVVCLCVLDDVKNHTVKETVCAVLLCWLVVDVYVLACECVCVRAYVHTDGERVTGEAGVLIILMNGLGPVLPDLPRENEAVYDYSPCGPRAKALSLALAHSARFSDRSWTTVRMYAFVYHVTCTGGIL